MKQMLSLVTLMGLLLVTGCRESDVRTMTVNIPALSGEEDVQRIRKALAPLNGVNKEQAVYDVKAHTVILTYDSMVVAHKNIEIAIVEAGYEANGIPAIRTAAAK